MPFVDAAGRPLTGLALDYRGGVRFQVAEPFAWIDPTDGSRHDVPAHDLQRDPAEHGNSTDLASVPPFLWGLVASYGRQTLPAVLHDSLASAIDERPRRERLELRRHADALFRRALLDAGLTGARATTMWCAVRIESYWRHARPLGILLAAQLAIGALASIAAVVLAVLWHPLALLLVLAPAVGALCWGRRVDLVLPAAYLAALYAPLIAAAAVASGSEYLTAVVLYLVGGRRGVPPTPGPTLRAG